MFALQAQRGLYTWLYQTFWCLEASKLCRTVSNISTNENKVRHAAKKVKSKRPTVHGNEENKELVLPAVNQRRKTQKIMSDSNDEHDLSETEMQILTDVMYDILAGKILSSHGKNKYERQIKRILKPSIYKSIWVDDTPKENPMETVFKDMMPEDDQEFSFPLCNTLTDKTREEVIVHLRSKIPNDFSIGEDVVSSTQILESTSSTGNLPKSQKLLLSNEDKQTLDTHLSLHVVNYIQKRTPPDFPEPDLPKHLLGYWTSLQRALKKMTDLKGFDIKATHPVLKYTATADIICSFNDYLVMIDWKTHAGLTNSSLSASDYMVQAIACVGALNFDVNLSFPEPLHAVSLVSYPSGKPGHLLFMNSAVAQQNWKEWLQRLSIFYREHN